MTQIAQDYELVEVGRLSEHPANPRRGDVESISASIEANGFYGAVVAQRSTGRILAGNHRWRAATALGAATLPVIWLDVDDDRARRILLADNRTNDQAGYDEEALADLLSSLALTDDALAGTGYSEADLLALLTTERPDDDEPDEQPAPEPPADPVTQPGDVWILGRHRLVCGDCRQPGVIERLMDGRAVNVAFTSPPYASQRTYDESSGFKPIPPGEYVDWFEPVQAAVRSALAEDGSWFVNISPGAEARQRRRYVLDLVVAHLDRWHWHYVDDYCWPRSGMPLDPKLIGRLKIGFELVYAFADSDAYKFRPDDVRRESDAAFTYEGKHNRISHDFQGTPELAERGGSRTTVGPGLAYPSTMLPGFGSSSVVGHAAVFPVGLPSWFIKAYSDPGDAILDPFMGSGTTLIAAEQTGRTAYGVEISPAYCDVIATRYQTATGDRPVLERTGQPVDFPALPTQ